MGGYDKRRDQRRNCHSKKDSKGQIWLPAPSYAPQSQEQGKTANLQPHCHH
jgi:hypothetical protein